MPKASSPFAARALRPFTFCSIHCTFVAEVRDADGGHVRGLGTRGLQHFGGHTGLRGPDFLRVVLHPARLGENLAELLLRRCHDAAVVIEKDGP